MRKKVKKYKKVVSVKARGKGIGKGIFKIGGAVVRGTGKLITSFGLRSLLLFVAAILIILNLKKFKEWIGKSFGGSKFAGISPDLKNARNFDDAKIRSDVNTSIGAINSPWAANFKPMLDILEVNYLAGDLIKFMNIFGVHDFNFTSNPGSYATNQPLDLYATVNMYGSSADKGRMENIFAVLGTGYSFIPSTDFMGVKFDLKDEDNQSKQTLAQAAKKQPKTKNRKTNTTVNALAGGFPIVSIFSQSKNLF